MVRTHRDADMLLTMTGWHTSQQFFFNIRDTVVGMVARLVERKEDANRTHTKIPKKVGCLNLYYDSLAPTRRRLATLCCASLSLSRV